MNEISSFGQVEEEILSRELPKMWGKIEIGFYSYQLSRGAGADHFNLKSKETVLAFVNEAKHKKSVQLCVYQERITRSKEITYGSSVVMNDPNVRQSCKILVYHVILSTIFMHNCTLGM